MDAEHLEFPDASFDAVLCGFSLQFLPHLDDALGGFRRVLKARGSLAVTTWANDDPAWGWFDDLRKQHGAVLRLGSNSLDTPEKISDVLSRAGFADVTITSRVVEEIYADEEEWWNVEWSISGREGLERLGSEALQRFKDEAFAAIQARRTPRGFPYKLEAFAATAIRPERGRSGVDVDRLAEAVEFDNFLGRDAASVADPRH